MSGANGFTFWLSMTVALSALGAGEQHLVDKALDRLDQAGGDPMAVTMPASEPSEVDGRPRLAMARSIVTFHAELDTHLAILDGDVLPLLSLARNNRHLGLRERALDWYRRAELADRDGTFMGQIREEMADTAIEIGDSSIVLNHARLLLARDDAVMYADRIGNMLGVLLQYPLGPGQLELARSLDRFGARLPVGCALTVARTYELDGNLPAWHAHLRGLLARGDELSLHQLAVVLQGIADSFYRVGHTAWSRSLYERFREHNVGTLSAWATYQLGVLASLDGAHDVAQKHFRSLCEREQDLPWREEACWRQTQSEAMARIYTQLREHSWQPSREDAP